MLRVAWLGTYVNTQHDDHEAVVGQGEIDLIHDQDIFLSEARLAFDIGITRQLGASLVLPVRMVSTSIRYVAGGNDVELEMPGIHHRNETLTGFGDPMVLGSFTTPIGPARVVVRSGFTLPLGRTEDNPFTAEAETMPHQHVQMGSGTVNPVVAADVAYAWGKWRFGGFAFTQQTVYENSRGYKAGDRYAGGLALSRRLGKKWSLRGGAEVQGETAEHWNGATHTDDGNRGRFDAMFVGGGSWAATERLAIDFTIKVPFISEAVGGQLDMPAILEVGATWRFGKVAPKPVEEEEHEHGDDHAHEHGDEHGHGEEGDKHEHGDEHAHSEEGDKHGDEHAHGDKPAVDEPVVDKPVVDKPVVDKPVVDKPVSDKPVVDKPVADKPGVDKPVGDKPLDKPVVDKPVADKPVVDKPTGKSVDKPVAKPPVKPAAKVDVADYNKPGEAPDLVPVKGKITIFDFWAAWCVPCKTLDPALVEMARQHPDLVVIRKLDVVDWDSKAAERYLTPGGFDLPHLKIYDPSGKRVLEKSSAPGKLQELIDQTRAIVDAEAKKRGAPVPAKAAAATKVDIKADAGGFSPAKVVVQRGVPISFTFDRGGDRNCASEVVFEIDGKKVEKKLAVGRNTFTMTFAKAGTVKFACAMNMYRGTVEVR